MIASTSQSSLHPSQQPKTSPYQPASIWDRIPSEIINAIINSSDILTRYLNNDLNDIQIQNHATEIWNEAFRQDWPGDLTLLPSFGVPSAFTGLYLVHSKSMLDQLRLLRPDLGITTPGLLEDTFQITFRNNTNFGWFPGDGSAPIVLLDFTDTVEPGRKTVFNHMLTPDKVFTSLSKSLFHISVRNCWFEDLAMYITDNPIVMARYAIHGDHFRFLQYRVDTIKVVDLSKIVIGFPDINPYVAAAKHNNLDMFVYLHKKRCPVGNSLDRRSLLTHLIDMGRLKILQYIHSSRMISSNQDFNSAKRIVAKLGTVNLQTLRMNAYKTSVEVFQYLWQHRSHPDPRTLRPDMHSLEADVAMLKLIDFRINIENAYVCSVDAYRRAHENDRVPNCHQEFVRVSIQSRNVGLLHAIHDVCKCPDLKFSFGDMDLALTLENREA
ncbi:hypothetical protein HDU76_013752, partial [Blyttiomyces sp. JEL0837]